MDDDDLVFHDALVYEEEPPAAPRTNAPPIKAAAASGAAAGAAADRTTGTASTTITTTASTGSGGAKVEQRDDAGAIVARAINEGRVAGFGFALPSPSSPPLPLFHSAPGRGPMAGRRGSACSGGKNGGGTNAMTLTGSGNVVFRPLLGSENRKRWSLAVVSIVSLARKHGIGEVIRRGRSRLEYCLGRFISSESGEGVGVGAGRRCRRRRQITSKDTLTSTAALVSLSLLLITAPGYYFLVTAAQTIILLVVAVFALLFDLDELASLLCPDFAIRFAKMVWRFVEGRFLLGNAYVGRRWVEASSGVDADASTWKSKENLVSRWKAKFGHRFGGRKLGMRERELLFASLEKDRIKAAGGLRTSHDTDEHMIAMNFCYTMLRGDRKGRHMRVRDNIRDSMKFILGEVKGKREDKETKANRGAKPKQDPDLTNPNGQPTPKVANGFSKKCNARRRRTFSWPPPAELDNNETCPDELEIVVEGATFQRTALEESNLDANGKSLVPAQLHGDDWAAVGKVNVNEGFEVIESRQHAKGKQKMILNEKMTLGLKRIHSDSNFRKRVYAYDDSIVDVPHKTSDIHSTLSLSFDGLDGTDSLTTASSLVENRGKELTTVDDDDDDDDNNNSNNNNKAGETELNWLDVGAKIGIRILNSEKMMKAMANPATTGKVISVGENLDSVLTIDKVLNEMNLSFKVPDEKIVSTNNECATLAKCSLTEQSTAQTPSSKPLMVMIGNGGTSVASPLPKPVHAIWTCAGAAIYPDSDDSSSTGMSTSAARTARSDTDDEVTKVSESNSGRGRSASGCDRAARGTTHTFNDTMKQWPSSANPPSCLLPSPLKLWRKPSPQRQPRESKSNDTAIDKSVPRFQYSTESRTPHSSPHSTADALRVRRRKLIPAGVKMVVPICPIAPSNIAHHGKRRRISQHSGPCHYQMATVVSSKRIYVPPQNTGTRSLTRHEGGSFQLLSSMEERKRMRQNRSNCLSITVHLDKSFLRDGRFAKMTIRLLDEWTGKQYMPRHSKYPIGSCVATSFGIGVLVGWRVEDDCHVVRSLWRKRGPGSALAYLNRSSLHGVVEAAVGFRVETAMGRGDVVAYVKGGPEFLRGKYFVAVRRGRLRGEVLEFSRSDVSSCQSQFIPVIEQIRESAKYQIQLLTYEMMHRDHNLAMQTFALDGTMLNNWYDGFELIMSSFIRAVEEDEGVNKWLSNIIFFLESLDFHGSLASKKNELVLPEISSSPIRGVSEVMPAPSFDTKRKDGKSADEGASPGLWLFDDLFGVFFSKGHHDDDLISDISSVTTDFPTVSDSNFSPEGKKSDSYTKAYAFVHTALRTISIARASVPRHPNLKLGLGMCYEVMLFIRTVIKVQEKNVSPKSLRAWKRTFNDIVSTFGPLKRRLCKLGTKIIEKIADQGKAAKIRLIRFVDILMIDDVFLQSLESGAWDETIARIQLGLVRAGVIDLKTAQQYLKTAKFIYNNMAPRTQKSEDAATRNGEKLARFALALKWLASPQRSFLALLTRDDVLDFIERLLVRVYQKNAEACNLLNIYAFNFHSFRHLRILNNMAIAGKLWNPVLDAADEEFTWAVSRMPDNAREFVEPISKLFSLGVARFRQIKANDLTSDWLDFLTESKAVKIIQQLDLKLILNLESFCNDLKAVMVVLPYYSSIDDDILNFMDEIEPEKILKEAVEALVDTETFAHYVREKSALAVRRFLDYLPKMSIPVERRELGEGWVLTCRDKEGGDLRLSDVGIEREYMTCNVIGSGNVLSPVDFFGDGILSSPSWLSPSFEEECNMEYSVLNDIADLIVNAQQHGSWQVGVGGIHMIADGKSVDPALDGLPVSEVLKCGIELWKNLEIDDEELMEIAIRDVSFQIQLQKDREEGTECVLNDKDTHQSTDAMCQNGQEAESGDRSLLHTSISVWNVHDPSLHSRRRFNPKKDPTVLFLEMKKVSCHLKEFLFRVEQKERSTIYDPVFEGLGSLSIKNLSIRLRVECKKERMKKLDTEVSVPVLRLQELEIQLEKVKVKFRDTGADWLLNKITRGFRDKITEIVASNVKEQIGDQIQVALDHLNSYIEVNPDLMLTILGITIDDLEENVPWAKLN